MTPEQKRFLAHYITRIYAQVDQAQITGWDTDFDEARLLLNTLRLLLTDEIAPHAAIIAPARRHAKIAQEMKP